MIDNEVAAGALQGLHKLADREVHEWIKSINECEVSDRVRTEGFRLMVTYTVMLQDGNTKGMPERSSAAVDISPEVLK